MRLAIKNMAAITKKEKNLNTRNWVKGTFMNRTILEILFIAILAIGCIALYAGSYDTNLLLNPGFESGFDNWTTTNGGDGWAVYDSGHNESAKCVVSSYQWCTKKQEVDLLAAGFTAAELDNNPILVNYSEWYYAWWGGKYYVTVTAYNASHSTVTTSTIGSSGNPIVLANETGWGQFTGSFVFSPGVRYIEFFVGGMDTRYWGGQFGTVFDDASLSLHNENTLPVELSSFTATMAINANAIEITWITQSETNNSGFHLYRSLDDNLESASLISLLISDATAISGTMRTYKYNDAEVEPDIRYYYWLESLSLNGASHYFGPVNTIIHFNPDTPPPVTKETCLNEAYPNPFSPLTTISYYLKEASSGTIEIYNQKGQLIRNHHFSQTIPDTYNFVWDGRDESGNEISSGVYFYKMTTGSFSSTKKLVYRK